MNIFFVKSLYLFYFFSRVLRHFCNLSFYFKMCIFNLNHCCCYFNLKPGTLIIGVTDFILGITVFLQLFVYRDSDAQLRKLQSICAILTTIAGLLLVIGVRKGYQRFILFWILIKIVSLFGMLIAFLTFLAVVSALKPGQIQPKLLATLMVCTLLAVESFFLQFYFLMVVVSYKRRIDMKSFIRRNDSTA